MNRFVGLMQFFDADIMVQVKKFRYLVVCDLVMFKV